jgi:hypothetical protein
MLNHSLKAPAGKSVPNIKSIIAANLFNVLKKAFANYINYKLNSNLDIEYAHVYDTINVYFPEVIEGIAFTIIVTEDELNVVDDTKDSAYNTAMLEQHLINFLTEIAA